jgi:hypothetical protein
MNSHYSDFINANFDSSDFFEEDVTQEEIDAEMERVQRELEEERDALHPFYNWDAFAFAE